MTAPTPTPQSIPSKGKTYKVVNHMTGELFYYSDYDDALVRAMAIEKRTKVLTKVEEIE